MDHENFHISTMTENVT